MKDLHQLQFDLLHGNRFAEKVHPALIQKPTDDYHLGLYPKMEIQEITSTENAYNIIAKGVPKFSKLVNKTDDEVVFEWEEMTNGLSSFTVNKSDIESGEKYQFKLYNSREKVLQQSTAFTIE